MNSFVDDLAAYEDYCLSLTDRRFEQPVAEINNHLNRLGTGYFFDQANNAPEDGNGMRYGIATDGQASREAERAFVLMPGTFANGAWPHKFAFAEALRFTIAKAGLTSPSGEPIDVILTASPSMNSRFGFARKERKAIRRGDPSPVASRHNELLEQLGYTTQMGSLSISQAAVSASAQASDAHARFDVEGTVILGDPPHALSTNIAERVLALKAEDEHFKSELEAEKR